MKQGFSSGNGFLQGVSTRTEYLALCLCPTAKLPKPCFPSHVMGIMASSLQVPVWHMDAVARHARAIKFINAGGSDVTGQVHCHDISRLLIHNVTYKARTPSTLTRQTQRPPGLPSITTVFHNTNKPKDDSSRPSLWLSGVACLNGSHCRSICHPLFCLRFWRKTKDDKLNS